MRYIKFHTHVNRNRIDFEFLDLKFRSSDYTLVLKIAH